MRSARNSNQNYKYSWLAKDGAEIRSTDTHTTLFIHIIFRMDFVFAKAHDPIEWNHNNFG